MKKNLSKEKNIVLEEYSQIEFLVFQGKLNEARELIKTLEEGSNKLSKLTKATLDYYQALILSSELKHELSIETAQVSLKILRSTADNKMIGKLQELIGRNHIDMGNLSEAEQMYRDCLATWRRIEYHTGIFECYNRLAQIRYIRGDYDESADFLQNAIESFKANAKEGTFAELGLIKYTGNLARIYIRAGRWDEAEELLNECIRHNRKNDVIESLVRNLLSLGYLGIRKRDQKLCEDCFAEVRMLLESTSLAKEEAILYEYMGEYYTEFNKFQLAHQALQKALVYTDKHPSSNILKSQTLRCRAELYLSMANYRNAYQDAKQGLEIARKIGESIEEAGCLKVLALISLKYEIPDDEDYFNQAEKVYLGLKEKNELARMHLAFSSIDVEASDSNKIAWCRNHLNKAREQFAELKSDYYQAVVNSIEADLALKAGDFKHALLSISDAEESFDFLGDTDNLRAVYGLRRQLEQSMINLALSDANEYNIVKSIFKPDEYQNLKRGDIEQSLKYLAERVSADSALISIIDLNNGEMKPLAKFNMNNQSIPNLLDIIDYAKIRGKDLKPFFITSPYESSNGSAEVFAQFQDVGSMILIPSDLGSQKSALIYLQRNGKDSSGCFSEAELYLSMAFADLIAFRVMEEERSKLENDNLRLRSQLEENCVFPNIITGNKEMLAMLDKVIQVKDSSIAILLQGETGCGKDLLAKTIHYNSVRKEKRFITVNCAALPETLLESELFGYKKGAFTGADKDRAGLFEEADGGTFFLDEIGEMPPSIQAKLLRVLEDQEVVRLGDTRGRKVDVRILSATNRELKEMMQDGHFRQDLYYRLSAMTLKIPPLRDRKEDIPLLISHFLGKAEIDVRLTSEVKQYFINYSWPGNVRELDNEIKKLVLLVGENRTVAKDLLSKKFFKDNGRIKDVDLPEIDSFGPGFSLYEYISLFEKKYITEALKKNRWVKKHAANSLGIPESTLRLKIKDYKIAKETN